MSLFGNAHAATTTFSGGGGGVFGNAQPQSSTNRGQLCVCNLFGHSQCSMHGLTGNYIPNTTPHGGFVGASPATQQPSAGGGLFGGGGGPPAHATGGLFGGGPPPVHPTGGLFGGGYPPGHPTSGSGVFGGGPPAHPTGSSFGAAPHQQPSGNTLFGGGFGGGYEEFPHPASKKTGKRYKLEDIIHPDDKHKYGKNQKFECTICMDIWDDPVEAKCGKGHVFCRACLDSEQINCCPMCRYPFRGGPKGDPLPEQNEFLWKLLREVRVRSFSS